MDSNHPAPPGRASEAGPERAVELVAGDFLLTVNPVDGCEIEPCPPGRRPIAPRRAREPRRPDATAAVGDGDDATLPLLDRMLDRQQERHRLGRLLAKGRSVRVTGPSGAGRTTLLTAVAKDCAELAPDGVIRLSGHHRTVEDLLQELYAAAYHTPRYRPGRTERSAALREIGAVVVVDDVEFGGAALDELFDATPECAFLLSSSPGTPAARTPARLTEFPLAGLNRDACLELLARCAGRPLDDAEAGWGAVLWHTTEGLPLRFVQAGALLRHRDQGSDGQLPGAPHLATTLVMALPDAARDVVRLAVALGGELPDPDRLPTLIGDPQAAAAHAEVLASGLVTAAGTRHRVSAATAADLAASGLADDAPERALAAAGHYTHWYGEPSASAERAGVEADVLLAVARSAQRGGHAAAVSALARGTAPLLAAALRWSAWERMLRNGGESARSAGDVAHQAYFHHELGVLAICQGRLDRARAELEASTALRGVLSDTSGSVLGRRALALAQDLTRPAMLPSGRRSAPLGLPPGTGGTPAAGADAPAASAAEKYPQTDGGGEAETRRVPLVAAVAAVPGAEDDTRVIAVQPAEHGGRHGRRSVGHGARAGARRNVVAAGAGAVLAAVLGTFVAFGLTSGDGDEGDSGGTDPTVADPDTGLGGDATTPEAESDTPTAEDTGDGGDDTTPSESETPDPTTEQPFTPDDPTFEDPTTTPPSDDPTTPGPPTESETGSVTTGGGSGGTDEGTSEGGDGGTDEGTSEGGDGGTDEGTSEGGDGGTDEGTSEGGDGGTDEGTSEGGDGGTDEGTSEGSTEGSTEGTTTGTTAGTSEGADGGGTGTPSETPTATPTAP